MPPRPKRHHYVTRAYLEGFLEPSHTQLYCWRRHRTEPFRSRPDEIAFERNYYSFRNPDGTWNDRAETFFAERIEAPGLPVLRRLASGNTRLNWDERNTLSLLLALQEFRVPSYRREMARLQHEMISQIVSDYEANAAKFGYTGRVRMQAGETSTAVSIERLRAELEESSNEYDRSNLALLFSAAYQMSEIYSHMKWTVFYSDGEERFMTSDSPVIRLFNSGKGGFAGLLRPDVEVRFPLSRSAMLSLTHDVTLIERALRCSDKERIRLLSRLPEVRIARSVGEDVDRANRVQAYHSSVLILSGRHLPWASPIMKEPSKNVQMWVRQEAGGYRLMSEIRYFPGTNPYDR